MQQSYLNQDIDFFLFLLLNLLNNLALQSAILGTYLAIVYIPE